MFPRLGRSPIRPFGRRLIPALVLLWLPVGGCSSPCEEGKCPDRGVCKSGDAGDLGACPDLGRCPDGGGGCLALDCGTCPDAAAPKKDTGPGQDQGSATGTQTLEDDSSADFLQGTLSESGAKIYVTAKGELRLTDLLDVTGDGKIDLVFSNYSDGSTYKLNSYIYYSSSTGFSSSQLIQLPGVGALGLAIGDLDADGYTDLVVGNHYDGTTHKLASYIYKGSVGGLTENSVKSDLPTVGASGLSLADLDRDGYLDLAVSSSTSGTSYVTNSTIYHGSSAGLSAASKKTALPTLGATDNAVADLDGDGYLDLVFANSRDASTYKVNSYIYWGSASGFTQGKRSELPTLGASGVAVADLDGDGALDLVFANQYDGSSYLINSYIYKGSSSGFSSTVEELPTEGAAGVSVGYLDPDTYLDIVFSNTTNGTSQVINSSIYYGSSSGYQVSKSYSLPTLGAMGNLVADFDGDGYTDLAFANNRDATGSKVNSYIYYQAKAGFVSTNRVDLPTVGARQVAHADPGSVASRKPEQTFLSRIHQTKVSSPTYLTIGWTASVPKGTSLRLELRSAKTKAAVTSAAFSGPTSTSKYYEVTSAAKALVIGPAHDGNPFIQYRATLSSNYTATPVLDKVAITYK